MRNMAGVSWHGPRKAITIEERRTIMNGRRWKSNFVASTNTTSRMTIGVFVIFLSLQGILVKGVSAATTQPDIHPEVQTTTTAPTRAPTKSNPQATHLPLSPYKTIVPQRDLKFQQQQQQQQSTAPKNSVGYVAEWEYEGVTSPAMDEVVEQESFGMEQVSPLREGERRSGGGGTDLENEDNSGTYPSRRVGPGTWQDSRGSWWLFGGQGPTFSTPTATSSSGTTTTTDKSIHYLSDLWVYEPEKGSWRLVFRPESESSPIHSSYPENLAFPHVCGSETNGHIAVFGGGGISGTTTNLKTSRQGNPTLPFTDDNVVWLFDVPINKTNQGQRIQLDSSWDASNGLWTSYICCDACLPDGNTSLEFCPRFSREPILWCGQDSLMALQLSHSSPNQEKSLSPTEQKEDNNNGKEEEEEESGGPLNSDINGSTSEERNRDSNTAAAGVKPRTSSGGNLPEEIIRLDIHSNPPASNSDNNPEKRNSGSSSPNRGIPPSSSQQQQEINNPVSSNSRNTLRATWWKFDLAATEWEKMPEVNVTKPALDLIEQGDCRTVSDQYMVYILCPSKENPLQRSVLLFDPTRPTIDLLQDSKMELNNAFRDPKVWQLGRSTLKALRTDRRMTILFLAYHKLLDLWIHDHSSNRIYPVENVWKGSSLHAFQLSPAFYKITVSFPTSAYNNNPTNRSSDTSETSEDNNNSKNNGTNSYTFYMENPRSKLFQFFDHEQNKIHDRWTSTGRFHISIVTDKLVFLPSRDASFLINEDAHPATTSPMTSKVTTTTGLPPSSPTATSTTQSFNTTEKVLQKSTLNPSRTTSTTTTTVIQQSSPERSNGTSNSTATLLTSRTSSHPEAAVFTTSRSLTQADAPPPPPNSPHMSTEQKLTLTSLNPPTPEDATQAKFNINSSSSTGTPHKTQPLDMTSTSSSTKSSPRHNTNENVNGNIIKGTSIIDPPLTQQSEDRVNNSTHVHPRNTTPKATVVHEKTSNNTSSPQPAITPSSSLTSSPVPPPPPPASSAHFKANNKPVFTSSTKRIPKGIVKVVNGKIAESSSISGGGSKTVNLHPVRKGAGLIFEKNKSGEVVAAMQRIQKEITTPPVQNLHHHKNEQGQDGDDDDDSLLHETLRTNRVVSQTRWNSSRGVREDGLVVNRPGDEALRQSSSSTAASEEPAAADLGSKIPRFSTDKYDNGDDDSSQVTASSSSSSGRSSSMNEDESSSSVNRISSSSNYDSFPASLDEDEEDRKGHRGSVAQSYGSSEMALETMTAIKSVGIHEGPGVSPSYSSMLFFAVSLSIFGVFGIVLFVRRCVKCPPRNDDSVLIKEPPPIRYSVIPDELSYHTPIV